MRLKTTLIIVFGLLFAFINVSVGQLLYNAEKKFVVTELQHDFKILRHALEQAHIGLYRYSGKESIDAFFDSCYARIDRPMTEIDFFRLISGIMLQVRDEHTYLLPSADYWKNEIGQTTYSGASSKSKARLFPFFIKIINDRLFIENNLSGDLSLQEGTEILAINHKPAAEVIAKLLVTVHTNGLVETFRYRNLEQFSLNQTYNRFIVHYAIYIGRPDTFHLEIKRTGAGQSQSVKVAALASSEIFNNYWRRYSAINDSKKVKEFPVNFKLLNPRVAYLRLSDFHNYVWQKYNLSYSTEYRNDFKFIKDRNLRHLIIDLRGNEGGNLAIGMDLLKYISIRTYRPYHYHELKNYRFPSLYKYIDDSTTFDKYRDSMFIKVAGNVYRSDPRLSTEVWSRPMEPVANPYNGKLYVLVDGATGSAASILATLIRVNRKDAIFIGEESGGDMEGPVSGDGLSIVLPNTKLRAEVPYIKRVVNLNGYPNEKGRGVMPDYHITPIPEDLTGNKDTELEFTLKLIQGQ